jgi:ferredoxin
LTTDPQLGYGRSQQLSAAEASVGSVAVSETEERVVDNLTLRIDRSLCVGFAQCVDESEEAFGLDDGAVVRFESPDQVSREELLRACESCPVEALKVIDAKGNQLIP